MPIWVLAPLIPTCAALFAWVLKRAVASVIDERITPQIQGIRLELQEHMRNEEGITDRILTDLTEIRERVARLEG